MKNFLEIYSQVSLGKGNILIKVPRNSLKQCIRLVVLQGLPVQDRQKKRFLRKKKAFLAFGNDLNPDEHFILKLAFEALRNDALCPI